VIDKVTRRKQGAHYTPEEAILKVIGPLFLDDLRAELSRAKGLKSGRERALRALHDRMGALTFLDPACGAGNFLVVAYRELRELEREILHELLTIDGRVELVMDVAALSKLDVDRFFGIELDEFPAMIAQVALWMTDHIANTRLAEDFGQHYARIPLVKAPGIRHADALETDWNDVVPAARCSYVFGNPPFLGKKEQTPFQKEQVRRLFRQSAGAGEIDYVACWFAKAARFHAVNRTVEFAFIATNSITQGEQVAHIWPSILPNRLNDDGLKIRFAHRTFEWNSQSRGMAHVHVVVIGLSSGSTVDRRLFDHSVKGEATERRVANINAYLAEGPQIYIRKARQPVSPRPVIAKGSEATDFGYLTVSRRERDELIHSDGFRSEWLRPFVGGDEYINAAERWCLWLKDANPAEVRRCDAVVRRLQSVAAGRRDSSKARTRALADFPSLFGEDRQPDEDYIIIPKVSSQRRDYLPMGLVSADVIVSGSAQFILGTDRFVLGLVMSRMHMGWLRVVGGRTKSDYQYSNTLVYNNFPWPDATPAQRAQVEALAQAVLDARALPKNATSTLADLYDPDTMPAELRRAHRDLDQAVDRLYRKSPFGSDRERVEHLFALYQTLVDPIGRQAAQQPRRIRRKAGEG
jgi:hypothetical protein